MIRVVIAGIKDVLVNPPDAGCVGTEFGFHPGGQTVLGVIEIFQHALAGVAQAGSVREDDVHHRRFKHAESANRLRAHAGQCRRERIGDLVLDDLRRLSGVIGDHDHLHIREVGDRVDAVV